MRKVFVALGIWLKALRLRTWPLAWAVIVLGSALAYDVGAFEPIRFVLALATAMALQLLSNLANDLGDGLHGVDHAGRRGPERMLAGGLLSARALGCAVWGLGIGALGLELYLLNWSFGWRSRWFWFFLLLGMFAIWAAVRYAHGSRPYGHRGGGDVSVWFFFGPLGVAGSYLLYTNVWQPCVLWMAAGMGCWATAVLNLNNMRDFQSDYAAGKRTLVTYFGIRGACLYHRALLLAGAGLWLLCGMHSKAGRWQWLFVLGYPLLLWMVIEIQPNRSARWFTGRLRGLVLFCLLEVLLFAIGIWLRVA